jgi:hypothetical protein
MKSGSLIAPFLLSAGLSLGLLQTAGAHDRTFSLFILDGGFYPGLSGYRYYGYDGCGYEHRGWRDYGHRRHHGHDRYRHHGRNPEWRLHGHDGGKYD